MAEEYKALVFHLEQTMSPDGDTRRTSEKFLEACEKNPGYGILLLRIVKDGITVSLNAAITFKNFIDRNWRMIDDEPGKISEKDRIEIKSAVVTLMLHSPEILQKQLSEAISIIGREDFPEKWPHLLDEMIGHFSSGEFSIINGVLRTAHTLFKRYRHEFRSDNLWTEIKIVLGSFAKPLTDLFDQTVQILPKYMNDAAIIKTLYSSMVLIAKIFYSLNYQDLPEFFEDNMKTWMTHFKFLLETDVPILNTDSEDEAGLLELLRSQICENAAMYAQKYDEEFKSYLPDFVTSIWNLLIKTSTEMKYDLLVSNAINYLRSVCERPQYRSLFEKEESLLSICQKVVIPNMQFRPSDLEMFEDNPDEYIRRDMEGSDVDTRRRAACDLVRAFVKQFEQPTTQLFSQYVNLMLQRYAESPDNHWIEKDAAIYLVTSLAQQGTTQKHGATKSNQFVNLMKFFTSQIVPELQNNDPNRLPVLKADCLRFVVTFRTLLGKNNLLAVLPLVIKFLDAPNRVLHTYAAHVVERLLVIKADGNVPLMNGGDIEAHLGEILTKIFNAMKMEGSEENEYMMKTLMRVISLSQEKSLPFMQALVTGLSEKLQDVCKNPSKPHFNHYLFECLSLCIRITCTTSPEAVASFEEVLFTIFCDNILQRDIVEFIPYVFQVMSLLLEIRQPEIPEIYMNIFPHLLNPLYWERPGNIAPLVRLIQAIIEKNGEKIEEEKMTNLLGVFQKLNVSKSNDQHGFALITSMIQKMPSYKLTDTRKSQIFTVLFKRLMQAKTTKYVRGLLVFFSIFIIQNSPDVFQQIVDSMQAGMFKMIVEKVIVADMQKVHGKMERKTCFVGFTRLLTTCTRFFTDDCAQLWVGLLEALIGVLELPEDKSVADNEHFVEIDETPGYQAAYSQLVFANKKKQDPVNVDNPKLYLAQSLGALSKNHPISAKLSAHMNPKALGFLQNYLNEAQVQIS